MVFFKCIHKICIIAAIAITGGFWGLNLIGLSQFGLCQITSTNNGSPTYELPIINLVASVAYVLFGIYTYCYFKKHMPLVEGLSKRRYRENKLVSIFVIG